MTQVTTDSDSVTRPRSRQTHMTQITTDSDDPDYETQVTTYSDGPDHDRLRSQNTYRSRRSRKPHISRITKIMSDFDSSDIMRVGNTKLNANSGHHHRSR